MPKFFERRAIALALAVSLTVLCPTKSAAQATSGVITGSVVDSSGAAVPRATVALINANTGDKRDVVVDADGSFNITGVFPGDYNIRVEASGFKRIEQQRINISAGERAALPALVLEVGATTDSVVVSAQGDLVQTTSQERSAVLTGTQVENLASQGRMVVGLLRVIPGIPNPGEGGGLPNVNGLAAGYATMTTDGTPNTELGTAGFSSTRATLDAISEVKVLTSNYQAEYGVSGGAIIQIITKAGTNSFHGGGYWYKQHEMLNANSFFNNRSSVTKPTARVSVLGGTIGGPIYIPGKFNRNKDKLFFFWSEDDRRQPFANQVAARTRTVPTDLEKAGDFSKTLDISGKLVPIRDPLSNANFPGNIIPAARLNPNAVKLMSIFPQPNFFDRTVSGGNYNYIVQTPARNIRTQWVNRFDYNLNSKVRLYLRGIHELNREFKWNYLDTQPTIFGLNYIPKTDGGINSTQIISPSVVNEFLFGTHHRTEYRSVASPDAPLVKDSAGPLANYSRSKLGINLPLLYNNNAYNVIPAMSFADVPNAMAVAWSAGGYFPPTTTELSLTFSDSMTKIWKKHTFKGGLAVTHLARRVTGSGSVAGNFSFGKDTKNPNDANYGYANAMLGNFLTYAESTSVPLLSDKSSIVEWFVQDNWKVSKRLTLDYGIRLSWYTPYTQADGKASNFMAPLWTRAKAPLLYVPALDATNQRVAKNPLTNVLAPATLIGALVTGTGDLLNGLALGTDSGYAPGFLKRQGVIYGPRVGIAYDVFGDGKTALRVGGGIFHQTQSTNTDSVFNSQAPYQYTPTIYYGSMTNYFNTTGVLFPSATTRGYELSGQSPTVYSYSFGIQHDIGFGTIIDLAYVGNQSRHNTQTRNINAIGPGVRFLASAQDPTKPGSPLPDNFLVTYPGYSAINISDRTGNSNYNSLQAQANRRFAHGVQFGATWTWSKAMAYDASPSTFNDVRLNSYGRTNFDFTHVVVVNWVWDLPKASRLWNSPVTRWTADGWRLSGIATFQGGAPLNVTFTTVDGADLSGGGDAIRIDVAGNPYLPKGDRTFEKWFNPTAFRRPAKGTLGNMGRGLLSGPGTNNFDLTLAKDFSMKERVKFKLQIEAYNAFNHTQFSAVNSVARFDAAGAQVNAQFGNFSAARTPRNAQASLRITF